MNWIPEAEAAKKVQREPRTLRKLVKSGKWTIAYTALNGRSYHYSEKDINSLFKRNSTAIN